MPEFDFNGNDLARLNRLMFSPGIGTAMGSVGPHQVRRAGHGTDFMDYRTYVPGDDVRRIDWVVYARLRQPFIRVLEHEETLYVNLLIDLSRSMAVGACKTKAALACQLASGLAYVALAAGDHVSYATFSNELSQMAANLHGRSAITRLVRSLKRQPVGGTTNLAAAVRVFCRRAKHRGLVVILSDFLSAGDVEEPVRVLLAHRYKVLVVQILDPVDRAEGLTGPLRLVDSETGRTLDVVASSDRLADYQRRLRDFSERLESYCLHRGQFYMHAQTTDDYLELLARGLRQRGLLR